jgi:hypothetical protein
MENYILNSDEERPGELKSYWSYSDEVGPTLLTLLRVTND